MGIGKVSVYIGGNVGSLASHPKALCLGTKVNFVFMTWVDDSVSLFIGRGLSRKDMSSRNENLCLMKNP